MPRTIETLARDEAGDKTDNGDGGTGECDVVHKNEVETLATTVTELSKEVSICKPQTESEREPEPEVSKRSNESARPLPQPEFCSETDQLVCALICTGFITFMIAVIAVVVIVGVYTRWRYAIL